MRLATVCYLYRFVFAFSRYVYIFNNGSGNPVWHMILKPHRSHRCIVTKRDIILISKAATKTGCTDGVWNVKMYSYVYDTCIKIPLIQRNLLDFLATGSNSNNQWYYPRVFERTTFENVKVTSRSLNNHHNPCNTFCPYNISYDIIWISIFNFCLRYASERKPRTRRSHKGHPIWLF
jgi:hypothetical protein